MMLALTAPNGSPFVMKFMEEDATCMLEPWPVQTPTAQIVGSRLTIAGFGSVICQETFDELKDKLFKPKLASVTNFRPQPRPSEAWAEQDTNATEPKADHE